jgi:phenylacetate-coenzyme A ligase PaaK-like adenylate-forming protein
MGRSPEAFFGYGMIYRSYEFYDSDDSLQDLVNDYEEKLTGETEFEKFYEVMKDYPVDLIVGYDEDPSYFLYIKSTLKRAEWDEEVEITPEMLQKDASWSEQLRDATTKLGLPWREPKFLIASRYF